MTQYHKHYVKYNKISQMWHQKIPTTLITLARELNALGCSENDENLNGHSYCASYL